jgi:hypothetical protein
VAHNFKQLTDYIIGIGAAQVSHTQKTYLAHAIGVYRDMQSWDSEEDLCLAALFHSIYGTEGFQDFTLPLERREEMRGLIGERAERLAYLNCAMDRATLDAGLEQTEGPYRLRDRLAEEEIELSTEEYNDLCRLHLCDWLEQAPRTPDYMNFERNPQFRRMAERVGGIALETYERIFPASAAVVR